MKICCKCKIEKPLDSFCKDKNTKDGLRSRCKECTKKEFKNWYDKNPELVKKIRKDYKEYRSDYYKSEERKLKHRKSYIERTFNIPYELYEEMHNKQNGLCGICNRPETSKTYKYLAIDHCHKTGHIRGLLCNSCNRGIGMLLDNINIVRNALNYLKNNNYDQSNNAD
jgi:hypothetical protein